MRIITFFNTINFTVLSSFLLLEIFTRIDPYYKNTLMFYGNIMLAFNIIYTSLFVGIVKNSLVFDLGSDEYGRLDFFIMTPFCLLILNFIILHFSGQSYVIENMVLVFINGYVFFIYRLKYKTVCNPNNILLILFNMLKYFLPLRSRGFLRHVLGQSNMKSDKIDYVISRHLEIT